MIELIPAIDIIDGKCVRLSQGDYNTQKVYNENPVEVAKEFEAHGIHRLHIVDLDGAVSRHVVNYRVLDQIASRTSLVIDFGGGIKTDEDLVIAFDNGAQMVTLGSVAVKNPGLFKKWLEQYGNEKIILGADVKENKISVNGWKEESQCFHTAKVRKHCMGEKTSCLFWFLHKYDFIRNITCGNFYTNITSILCFVWRKCNSERISFHL